MAFSIRLTDEEKQLADSTWRAIINNLKLFEKIEDEYDVAVADEAYQDYLKSGKKSRPVGDLWKDLGI